MTAQNGTSRPPTDALESYSGVSADELQALLALVKDTDVTELDVTIGATRLSVRRPPSSVPSPRGPMSAAAPAAEPSTLAIASPLVGIFRPSVMEGDEVEHGAAIGAIEALGMPTTVDSPQTGTVEQVLIADGGAVEYGQPLVILRRAP